MDRNIMKSVYAFITEKATDSIVLSGVSPEDFLETVQLIADLTSEITIVEFNKSTKTIKIYERTNLNES